MKSVWGLLIALAGTAVLAADPPAVRTSRTVKSDPTPGVPYKLEVGRFLPLDVVKDKPALYDTDEKKVRVVVLKPGERLINQVRFDEPAGAVPADYEFNESPDGAVCFFGRAPGLVTVNVYVNGEPGLPPIRWKSFTIEITGRMPQPPPEPEPEPKPVDPVDPSKPVPIPAAGFRVLMVYEKDNLAKYPAAVREILYSTAEGSVRDYLEKNCVKEPDGKMPAYRVWDQNVVTTNAPQIWKDAFARPRTSDLWLIVSNGNTGYEGPMPQNPAEVLKILRQHGGK